MGLLHATHRGIRYRRNGCKRVCTVDVRLLVQFGDAEQVCPLLLAADPSLNPGQRSLEVKLVTAVCQRVGFPECLTGGA